MQLRKAYKFRLEPNKAQMDDFESICGCCRFVWNWMLDQRTSWYDASKEVLKEDLDISLKPNYFNQCYQLPALKKQYPWLTEKAPAASLQQCLKDLDKAFQAFFKGNSGYPKWRKKNVHNSFRFPQGFTVDGSRVKLPKIGWVKFRKSRDIQGNIKQVTVRKEGQFWFVSFSTLIEKEQAKHASKTAVGLDCGVVNLATLSNGQAYEPARALKKWKKRLKRAQRALSRKKKGSVNRNKARQKLSRIHLKIANIRQDRLHWVSTQISKNHACVYLEDLQIKNMSVSAKGNLQMPGSNVKAKSGLNRSILDASWGELMRQLEYKLFEVGGIVLKVDPRYTSQRCSSCGHTQKENRTTQSSFKCVKCGYSKNADVNAAKNILAVGQTVSACGDIRPVAA